MITIIGISSKRGGFGNYMLAHFQDAVGLGKGDPIDLDQLGDTVIINLFDHSPGNHLVQLDTFNKVFEHVKDQEKHVIAIGSTAHLFKQGPYEDAKRMLHNHIYELGKAQVNYKAKLALIEPGTMQMLSGRPVVGKVHIKYQEVFQVVKGVIEINPKFMHVALRGCHT